MSYQLVITEPAEIDMTKIGLYISKELHSPKAAIDLLDEIDQQILSLKEMPKRYTLVSDERLAHLGVRKIPIKNYLVFYAVDESTETVTIIRVMYGRRDWTEKL